MNLKRHNLLEYLSKFIDDNGKYKYVKVSEIPDSFELNDIPSANFLRELTKEKHIDFKGAKEVVLLGDGAEALEDERYLERIKESERLEKKDQINQNIIDHYNNRHIRFLSTVVSSVVISVTLSNIDLIITGIINQLELVLGLF